MLLDDVQWTSWPPPIKKLKRTKHGRGLRCFSISEQDVGDKAIPVS